MAQPMLFNVIHFDNQPSLFDNPQSIRRSHTCLAVIALATKIGTISPAKVPLCSERFMSRLSNSTDVEYPSGDGQPMAENTLQFEWIAMLKGGLDKRFRHDPRVRGG